MALPRELDEAAGRRVVDRDGHDLGHVIDIIYDEYQVEHAFLEVESDHTFERHHKHFLAPIAAADVEQNPIVVPISIKESEKPPGYHSSMPFSEDYEMAVLGFWTDETDPDFRSRRFGHSR